MPEGGVKAFSQAEKHIAEIAQLVEHNLAKVGVAGSNPVSRSTGNRNAYTFRFLRCGKIDEKEILFLKLKNIAF